MSLSLITNAAAGMEDGPINHAEVMEMGQRVSKEFCELLAETIVRL